MKDLLWLLGIIFWPLTAAIGFVYFFYYAANDSDLAAVAAALHSFTLAAIGGTLIYLGYFHYTSANLADVMKIIYISSIIFWAAAIPLPSKI